MKPHKENTKSISAKQRAADDELRKLLQNADFEKFGEGLKKVLKSPPAERVKR